MKKIILTATVLTPFLALAASTINDVIYIINGILTAIVPLLMAIALIIFMLGVIKYISAGGDDEKRGEGRNMMIYGIVGLAVMVSVWGIVNILVNTFGIGGQQPPPPPIVP